MNQHFQCCFYSHCFIFAKLCSNKDTVYEINLFVLKPFTSVKGFRMCFSVSTSSFSIPYANCTGKIED